MKKSFFSFASKALIVAVIASNAAVAGVFAYEKKGDNLEQTRIITPSDNSGVIFNKIDALPKEPKSISPDLSTIKKEKKNDYVEGEILVKYKNNKINLETFSGRAAALNFISAKSLEKKEDLRKINISVLKIKDNKTVEEKIAELKSDPNVEYAQPNFQYYPLVIDTNDIDKEKLWGIDNTGQSVNGVSGTLDADIDAPEAWAISEAVTSAPIIVAVIDTGVAYNHPDLVSNMWDGTACVGEDGSGNPLSGGCNHGYDYQGDDKTPLPTTSSHGTHIAGTIAAVKNNSKGIVGVAPQAKIMAIKSSLTTVENVKSINFAAQNGAKVINASWGSYSTSGEHYDIALYNAIDDFFGLFVVAAGNYGYNHDDGIDAHKSYPDGFKIATPIGPGLDNIIVVAATDQSDDLASFSDFGVTLVDIGAPGTNILSTTPYWFEETFEQVAPPALGDNFEQGDGLNWIMMTSEEENLLVVGGSAALADDESTVTSRAIDLSSSIDPYISFDAACAASSDDGVFVDFWNGSSWDEIGALGGNSEVEALLSLADYRVNDFRFRLVWLDEIADITPSLCAFDNFTVIDGASDVESYSFFDGTSMATPHVVGLAALIWGYKPELSYAEVKNTILSTGNNLDSLAGGTVTGKRINAFNALNSLSEKKPPYAVSIDNQKDARPISGVNEADVVYEFPVEGSITRLMAIYNPDSGVDPSVVIGPVRSARSYFARTASEHGAIYAHAGGSTAALQSLANHEYNLYNLEALATDSESYFWRDNSRVMPHNLYTSIEQLNNFREDIYLTGGTFTNPWVFSDNPSLLSDIGFSQGIIIINYENVNYNVKWSYNESDGLYYRQTYENGSYEDYLDINNNRVFASNLAIQYTATDGAAELIESEGEALLCREGNCIDGKWRKNSTDDNVKFYINNGNDEFDFKTGKLWVHVTNYSATLPDSVHTISGTIKYYDGIKAVPNATVILEDSEGNQLDDTATDANGFYQFTEVASGGDYVVKASKDDNFSSVGVTVSDLIAIKKHTLGTELNDIYKKIAADFNSNLSITVSDLIMLKKFTLERIDGRPASSWKFYSSSAALTATNYLTNGLNRAYTNLLADIPNQDFIGIKMGDVNNSWKNN